jgi:hypothetical protein
MDHDNFGHSFKKKVVVEVAERFQFRVEVAVELRHT